MTLPVFKEGERVVVGWMVLYPQSISTISQLLNAEAFVDVVASKVYKFLISNPTLDIGLLIKKLGDHLGDPDIITQLEEFVREIEDDLDVYEYIDVIRDCWVRRRGIETAKLAQDNFAKMDASPSQIASGIIQQLTDYEFRSTYIISADNYTQRRLEGLEARKVDGYQPTGFGTIDSYLTEGFAGGLISIIGGRPSMGKSTFKRNAIARLCDTGVAVLNVVPEMGFDREQDGIDAIRTGRLLSDFYRASKWDETFYSEIERSSRWLEEHWKYTVQADPFITFSQVEQDIQSLILKDSLNVVFIDLFDRLQEVSQAKMHEKQNIIKQILQRQAAIAKKHRIHFCNVVQIKRLEGAGAKDRMMKNRPTMDMLKDAGAFEEIADLIFLLYREGFYDDTVPDDVLDVILAKQRQGPRNKTIQLYAEWERGILDDMEQVTDD